MGLWISQTRRRCSALRRVHISETPRPPRGVKLGIPITSRGTKLDRSLSRKWWHGFNKRLRLCPCATGPHSSLINESKTSKCRCQCGAILSCIFKRRNNHVILALRQGAVALDLRAAFVGKHNWPHKPAGGQALTVRNDPVGPRGEVCKSRAAERAPPRV